MSLGPLKAVLALIALSLCYAAPAQSQSRKLASQAHVWKNVQIVGGGFVDGIIFHPTEKGLRYARTDIGGAYRWKTRTSAGSLCWTGFPIPT